MAYEPLSSVWEGSDGELIEQMLNFYPTIEPEPILDATCNAGRFWRRSTRKVVLMDIEKRVRPQVVCDNRQMACLPERFGAIVYDPPHIGNQGRDKSSKRFDLTYGALETLGKPEKWNPSYLYPAFLQAARGALKAEGLLLAKIADIVNNHRSKWPHCDFMKMALDAGFTVCDLIVKVRRGPMVSSKWTTAHHARKRHCFWVVCRNGQSCE